MSEQNSFKFTDDEWREYQNMPDQGYSHRGHLEYVVNRWFAEVKATEREACVNHVKFLYCSHSMEYRPYQEAVDDIVEVLTGKEDGSDVFDKWLAEVKAQACTHTFTQQLEEHSLAELIRIAKAEGFDEGWDARVNAETITPTENPYRQGETE